MYSYLRSQVIKKLDVNTQPFGMNLCLDMAMGFVGGRGQILLVFITCIMRTMEFCKYNVTK